MCVGALSSWGFKPYVKIMGANPGRGSMGPAAAPLATSMYAINVD